MLDYSKTKSLKKSLSHDQLNQSSKTICENKVVGNRTKTTDIIMQRKVPLKSALCSLFMLLHLLYSCIIHSRLVYFVMRLNDHLNFLTNNNQNIVSKQTTIFSFMQLFSFTMAPIGGYLIDKAKGHYAI